MARVMYIDAFAGAAGDMILGALIDAGLPVDELRAALGSLGVHHEVVVTRVLRSGLSATHVAVREPGAAAAGPTDAHAHSHPGHAHDPGHDDGHQHADEAHAHDRDHHDGHSHGLARGSHHHHTLAEITHHIGHSSLSAIGKSRAVAMFHRLAEAEAAIHAMPVEQVHLHEVGAIDSIIDIVGAVFAFEWFGIDDVMVSPVNVGHGTVDIAHGTFPIPAPATLRLLGRVPVYSRGPAVEMLTPTGALVLTTYGRQFGQMPSMVVERVGYGAGTRDLEHFPNVLRVLIGERAVETAVSADRVLRMECAIDDMTPQLFGPLIDRLLGAGALDAYLTAVQMKKGRPGTVVTVLAPRERREALCDVLFRETTTIGVRFDEVERETLEREWIEVPVTGGAVRVKLSGRHGEILNAVPEFDDCVRVAAASGRPVKIVQADALRAWFDRSRESNR
jgi:hypothetical protein